MTQATESRSPAWLLPGPEYNYPGRMIIGFRRVEKQWKYGILRAIKSTRRNRFRRKSHIATGYHPVIRIHANQFSQLTRPVGEAQTTDGLHSAEVPSEAEARKVNWRSECTG